MALIERRGCNFFLKNACENVGWLFVFGMCGSMDYFCNFVFIVYHYCQLISLILRTLNLFSHII